MAKHDHEQFREDMEEAGYEVRDYGGRMFWRGPAVYVAHHELQDVVRATNVRLQTDSMGLDVVVYPKAYARRDKVEAA